MLCTCPILSSVPCLIVQYLSTLSHKGSIFEKQLLNIKSVFFLFLFSLQRLCETFLILGRTERDIIMNVPRSSCTVPLFLSVFNESSFFATYFLKILSIKFHAYPSQWETSCSVWTDRRTDMTKPVVTFSSYAKRPQMYLILTEIYISALFLFRDNAVDIATPYGMDGSGIESWWVIFSALLQTCPGANPVSYTMRTGPFSAVNERGVALTTHPI